MTRVVVFGFDAAESSQIRRINSLVQTGHDVVAFTMRRTNMNVDFQPSWKNIHLFNVPNEQLFRRMLILLLSMFKIAWHRREIVTADVLIARNFDLLLLAQVARWLALRPKMPLIYECLDIHGSFSSPSRKGRAFRAIERRLLGHIDLLVVSSPGFIDNYFKPLQGYHGPVALLENKIWFGDRIPPRRNSAANVEGGKPWVIGWVGSLRCDPSFGILLEIAERMGEAVRIEMHGNVHHHVVPDFEARISGRSNITYHGPYKYPQGLAEVYSRCDFVWAQDMWLPGANSDWLLPNRIYEASYFGCLSIASSRTETGRKIERDGLGYTVEVATADHLQALLERLGPLEVEQRRARLLAAETSSFVYSPSELTRVIEQAVAARDLPQPVPA